MCSIIDDFQDEEIKRVWFYWSSAVSAKAVMLVSMKILSRSERSNYHAMRLSTPSRSDKCWNDAFKRSPHEESANEAIGFHFAEE
jgi:hypothetical protein